jgi:hypothetical protein
MISKEQSEEAFKNDPGLFHYVERELDEKEVESAIDKIITDVQHGKTLSDDFLRNTGIDSDEAKIIAINMDKIRRKIWRDYLDVKVDFSLLYFDDRFASQIGRSFPEDHYVYFDLILHLNKWMKNLMNNRAVRTTLMYKNFGLYSSEG